MSVMCNANNVSNCSGKMISTYCSKHYQQVKRHGKAFVTRNDSRPAVIEGNFAKIPLGVNAKDGYALVDKEHAYLAKSNWRLTHYGYAIRSKDKQLLHRVLKSPGVDKVIDHINGDPLDNRMTNLRECKQSDNSKNQRMRVTNSTGYKGVTFNKGKYVARLKLNYKFVFRRQFTTAIEAARAYDVAAKKYHGEFARLNNV